MGNDLVIHAGITEIHTFMHGERLIAEYFQCSLMFNVSTLKLKYAMYALCHDQVM